MLKKIIKPILKILKYNSTKNTIKFEELNEQRILKELNLLNQTLDKDKICKFKINKFEKNLCKMSIKE